jgi:hypothetical protein
MRDDGKIQELARPKDSMAPPEKAPNERPICILSCDDSSSWGTFEKENFEQIN